MAASGSSEMFAVQPKTDCPHVESCVSGIESLHMDVNRPCGACENVGENWVCLTCDEVFCSRYVNSHMVKHNEDTSHHVMLSFSDLSFWCYACDSYIESQKLDQVENDNGTIKYTPSSSTTPQEPSITEQEQGSTDTSQGQPGVEQVTDKAEGGSSRVFSMESELPKEELISRMWGVLYGNCIGDAIGLLSEFMTKDEAHEEYGTRKKKSFLGLRRTTKDVKTEDISLEYEQKCNDFHRSRWRTGDWTDDSDQMILILRTLFNNQGEASCTDFAKRLKEWANQGYSELGDTVGYGQGRLTRSTLSHIRFLTEPIECARQVWEDAGKWPAPNGGVMRTSVLGIQDLGDMDRVIENTKQICMTTHADPRCVASCVAVTTAIALMLQGQHCGGSPRWKYDVEAIAEKAFTYACEVLATEEEKNELRSHMFAKSLDDLHLSDKGKIGYTYKCLGAGFWALRQKDFRLALTAITMEAGDADTNGAVAGALLGCKLGLKGLPESWINGLLHKEWLDKQIIDYFKMLGVSH